MTRLYLPYVSVAPGVREGIKDTGWKATEVYVGGSDSDYWAFLANLWAEGETFIILEHDVTVYEDSFDVLNDCENDWCAFGLPYLTGTYPGIGCVKFGAELMETLPLALQRVGERDTADHPARHWCTIDALLRHDLLFAGFRQCVHRDVLGHWRDNAGIPQPTHGCCGDRVV